jgi:hypothetical protein
VPNDVCKASSRPVTSGCCRATFLVPDQTKNQATGAPGSRFRGFRSLIVSLKASLNRQALRLVAGFATFPVFVTCLLLSLVHLPDGWSDMSSRCRSLSCRSRAWLGTWSSRVDGTTGQANIGTVNARASGENRTTRGDDYASRYDAMPVDPFRLKRLPPSLILPVSG